jgi:hypothetical protein
VLQFGEFILRQKNEMRPVLKSEPRVVDKAQRSDKTPEILRACFKNGIKQVPRSSLLTLAQAQKGSERRWRNLF